MKFSTKDLVQYPADLVTFTEEILYGKLHFLCRVAKLVPFAYTQGRSTRHSDIVHDFSGTFPRCQ